MLHLGWRSHVLATLTAALVVSMGTVVRAVTLNGGGASSATALYDRFIVDMKTDLPNHIITYQGISSTYGLRQMAANALDFAVSDVPPSVEQLEQVDRGVIVVPIALTAVAVVYNLPDVPTLQLSRTALSDIFSGRVTQWNDPKIKADNPGVDLPRLPIKLVVRLDGSGTTYVFTNYLSAISDGFRTTIGTSFRPNWVGNPYRGMHSEGMAQQVSGIPGAIGYVELSVAQRKNLTMVAIQNRNGDFVPPAISSIVAARNQLKVATNQASIVPTNPLDPPEGYPIVYYLWLLLYHEYDSPEKSQAIEQMLTWVMTTGQAVNQEFGQVPIDKDEAATLVNQTRQVIQP